MHSLELLDRWAPQARSNKPAAVDAAPVTVLAEHEKSQLGAAPLSGARYACFEFKRQGRCSLFQDFSFPAVT